MKKLVALFVTVIFFTITSAYPVRKLAYIPVQDTIDVTKDMPLINASLKNLNCDSINGDAGLLNALFTYKFNNLPNKLLVLKFPSGAVSRIDTQVGVPSNVHIVFAGSARVVSTSLLDSNSAVFRTNGASNVKFKYPHWTNYQAKFCRAFIEISASPYPCYDIEISDGKFENTWTSSPIRLGYISNEDSTYWLDRVLITRDTIVNNRNPSIPRIRTGSDYHTNVDCMGIDVGNNYRKLDITYCVIIHTGGDGIGGIGLGKAFSHNKRSGNIVVDNNYVRDNNFNIEVNGGYLQNGPVYSNNHLWYPTYTGGYNMSVQGRDMKLRNNDCHSADNGNLEVAFYGGEATGNTCDNRGWKDTSMGYHHGAYPVGSRIANIYVYGMGGHIHHNSFNQDTSNKNASSPPQLNGIAFLSKAANGDSAYERLTWNGYNRAGVHIVENNDFSGQTDRFVDNSSPALYYQNEDVVIRQNNFISYNLTGTDCPFWINGINTRLEENFINVTGSASPVNDNALIKKVTGSYGEIIKDNIVKGGNPWIAATPNYKFLKQ